MDGQFERDRDKRRKRCPRIFFFLVLVTPSSRFFFRFVSELNAQSGKGGRCPHAHHLLSFCLCGHLLHLRVIAVIPLFAAALFPVLFPSLLFSSDSSLGEVICVWTRASGETSSTSLNGSLFCGGGLVEHTLDTSVRIEALRLLLVSCLVEALGAQGSYNCLLFALSSSTLCGHFMFSLFTEPVS